MLETWAYFKQFSKVFVPEFELFPSLRFVPPYRARFKAFYDMLVASKALYQREV